MYYHIRPFINRPYGEIITSMGQRQKILRRFTSLTSKDWGGNGPYNFRILRCFSALIFKEVGTVYFEILFENN